MIIDGKELARKTREKLKIECDNLKKEGILPKLAVIMVGDDKASQIYVKNKSKACDEVGIEYEEYILEENIKQEIEKRAKAKQNKDFEKADKIRNALEAKGIILKDSKEGTLWDFKSLYNG